MTQDHDNTQQTQSERPVDTVEALFREGRRMQLEGGIPPLKLRGPSLWPWAVVAGLLVVVSLAIEIFWPLPHRTGPLPVCKAGVAEVTSCQKVQAPSVGPSVH